MLGVAQRPRVVRDVYPTVELEDVAVLSPELVVVPSEPYDFTEAHLDELRRALPRSTVVPVDGHDLFWWGVRTPAAVERLGARLREAGGWRT